MSNGSWRRRHRAAFDATVAIILTAVDTVLTLVGVSWWPDHPGTLAWSLLGIQALVCLSLAVRRRFPLSVVWIVTAYTLLITMLIWPLGAITPASDANIWAPFATTTLVSYGPLLACRRRWAYIALAALTIVVARPWQPSAMIISVAVLRTAAGPLLALYFDARRRLVNALTERAERAEREQHLLAEQARADERARLAGEMHDVVTHRVSLMVLQAGALRVTAADEATRQAAEELRAAGCQALDELRDLVGILQAAPDGDEAPSTSDLAALVAESTAAGTPADLGYDGDPALASPVVGRTAYRVVREALTNVHKHAPGAQVTVRLRYDAAQVRVTVSNTAAPGRSDPALAASGSGIGLAGLRRRIELVRGVLRAGPAQDGGFCVEATLPSYVPTAGSVV